MSYFLQTFKYIFDAAQPILWIVYVTGATAYFVGLGIQSKFSVTKMLVFGTGAVIGAVALYLLPTAMALGRMDANTVGHNSTPGAYYP
ncbi:hypothetical protein D5S18_00925 [Nocardia panacis]|uniref:Uncharacterized protein n=1 Tax=Nocardia panacis TaxID=2340916 RepID=A0A3A4KG30_9NOCA|nr:hypothetical protein [Nocardia panacis]RJO79869.1 hypothetical protein D5S18_00925 [Nocardia panacis]